jgi:hypothetical protein
LFASARLFATFAASVPNVLFMYSTAILSAGMFFFFCSSSRPKNACA